METITYGQTVTPLMMKLHEMQLPREVIVGKGILGSIVSICTKLGFSENVIVVTGPKTHHVAGRHVMDLLEDAAIQVEAACVSTASLQEVNNVVAEIRRSRAQVVIGVGGGTKIDVAKLSAAREDVPFLSVPTTASHDGIASPMASIKGSDMPYSVKAHTPMAIIADTEIIGTADKRFTASGCGDVLAKFTAVRDWRLAHKAKDEYYGEYAASLALMSAKLVAKHADSIREEQEDGLRVLLEALISCGVAMSIAGSSRPSSGAEHSFSHALDVVAAKPAMHGEQVGVGTIMMAYLHELNWKGIKSKLQRAGAPATSYELGVEPEEVIQSLLKANTIRPERFTILSEKNLNYETAQVLAQKTGVI